MKDKELLRQDLTEKTGLAYFNSMELITFCPRCEKDRFHGGRSHGHLYISINDPIFKCFRCDFKGFIYKLFKELQLDINKYYDKNTLKINWSKTDSDRFIDKEYNTGVLLPVVNKDFYTDKLNYIKNRIPNYIHELSSNNIVFNIKEFISLNKINIDKDPSFIDFLESNFVGFLSARKSQLICRNIDTNSQFRYFKIKLLDIYFKDFYAKPLDMISNKIVLCEGVFDLHNIIDNSRTKPLLKNSAIIATALNNDYKNTLISVLDYVKIPFADVIIFSDSDLKEADYMPIYFNNATKSVTLYYNSLSKDFGTHLIDPVKIPVTKYIKRK